ncbi:lasso peptide biosynthesis B2 protein [Bacillus thuringiensis]|uniref:lasso peptide biosynthesis B2 protein n=1 Tax=Bacillus thuringiensis TaxID=1428 RepID=UPI003F6BE798
MNIVKKLTVFLSLDMKTRFLFIEAYIYLGWARILKLMSFSQSATTLGVYMDETSLNCVETNIRILKSIAEVIQITSRHTLWDSQCLVKAIAGMKMLERRKIESTLYLGTAKDEDGNMVAHAWLRSGPCYITGAEGMEKFTVVGTFAKKVD